MSDKPAIVVMLDMSDDAEVYDLALPMPVELHEVIRLQWGAIAKDGVVTSIGDGSGSSIWVQVVPYGRFRPAGET